MYKSGYNIAFDTFHTSREYDVIKKEATLEYAKMSNIF